MKLLYKSFLIIFAFSSNVFSIDYSFYANFLKKYVKEGLVFYEGIVADKDNSLDNFLNELNNVNLDDYDRNGKMAVYINAYNACTIKLIVDNYPIDSIKDVGSIFQSPWSKKICNIGGKTYTLDEIEHSILRKDFKTPLIHFALNCASKSCPVLADEPYLPEKLFFQMEQAAKKYINDKNNNYLKGDVLYLSSIFKWYKEDFADLLDFVSEFMSESERNYLSRNKNQIKIKYLKYYWGLNEYKKSRP